MGFKSFMQKVFGIEQSGHASNETRAKFLNGNSHHREPYSGELYANSLVRSCVHKIANYCSLVKFEHVRGSGDKFEKINDQLNKVLTVKPNSLLLTPAEMVYKHITDLFIRNNAYQWIKRDKSTGKPIALLPVVAENTEMLEVQGFLFYKFHFKNGDSIVVHSADVIHNRRFFYKNDYFGDSNEPLNDSVGLVDTMHTSLDAALKNGAQIKGILQHQNTIDPEDLKAHEQLFRESYLSASNSGGVGMIDAKFNFIPINYSGKITDADQMKEIRDYVYRYFGMNDKIMMSDFSSDTWQAYFESEISPILNNWEQHYNIQFFTEKELDFGNRVVSSINHITFMSPQQRISMVKLALDGALYNRNEIRKWFGDEPIPGGDVYQYSKNFTEQTDQNLDQQEGKDATGNETNPTDSSDAV